MNLPPEFFSGDPSPRKKELQLQGPRPTALKVNKDSYKIRKPPPHPPPPNNPKTQPTNPNPNTLPGQPADDRHQPVIIYAVSPKVIHTTVSDFMNLVQRLTGNSSGAGDVSPAARLASIEKVSPRFNKDREIGGATAAIEIGDGEGERDLIGDLCGGAAVEVEFGRSGGASSSMGILSPAPGSLPPISPGMFSPAVGDPFMMGGGYNYNMFIPSPSTLFSAPMVSPSPSSSAAACDLFNPFFDF